MWPLLNLLAFFAVGAYALYLFASAIYTRVTYVKLGKKTDYEPNLKQRLNEVLINAFGQRKLFKDKKSGMMHLILFYGFFIIQVGLIELIIKGYKVGFSFPFGEAYKFFTFLQEWTVFLMFLAVVYAFYRRYVEKLTRLQWKRDKKAAFVIIALIILTTTILFTLAFEKIALAGQLNYVFEPFSSMIATVFQGMNPQVALVCFYLFWWAHMLIVFAFMVFVPQSKQFHEMFAFVNIFFKRLDPVGKLRSIDFEDEEAEEFGVGKIEQFTRKQLMDLYACVECGRCTSMCPATGTGKALSPMNLIVKLRDHLTEKGEAITSKSPWFPEFVFRPKHNVAMQGEGASEVASALDVQLIGDVITEEEIWACTTCRNCEDQCPVLNEHVDKIIDLRRYLVLTEGKMDSEAQRAITNIERQGNPWGISRKERENWREGREDIDVPTVKELKKREEQFEYLFFVGSMGSYDRRSQKIAQSFAKVMNKAGITFAILGNKEKNSGDTPRRIGNEYLFQELVLENIDQFQKNNVKKIVTIDPHAYNTFKNEYPEFGLENVEVFHHTELLAKWLKEGRITPTREVNETITFHDSCYLGRYNDIYDAPREVLRAIPGVKIVEMERNRQDSMCCGAGGGLMWMEEKEGKRINVARTEQALSVSPTVISTGCPYCLTMITDGTKVKEAEVETLDVVEVLERAL